MVGKETTTSELWNESLESYDRVLSCVSVGKISHCSAVELHNVLKANALQFSYLKKEYIEQHFSMLSKVLFRTRFSSLSTGYTIAAMQLENSELVQDVSVLRWQAEASKELQISLQTYSEEMQNLKVSVGGFTDAPAVDLSAGIKCLQQFDTSPVSDDPKNGTTDSVESLVDDCYHPDMSMIEIPKLMPSSCRFSASLSTNMPNEMCLFDPEEEEYHMSFPTAGDKEELVTLPLMLSLYCEEQLSQSSTTSSLSILELDGEVVDSCSSLNHSHMASAEVSDDRSETEAEAKQIFDYEGVYQVRVQEQFSHSSGSPSRSKEVPVHQCAPHRQFDHSVFACETRCVVEDESGNEADHADMSVLDVLQLHMLHNFQSEDELSSLEIPHETASEGSLPVVAEIVNKSVGVEEDTSDKSYPKQEWLHHAKQDSCMMSSLQDALPPTLTPALLQTTTAESSFSSLLYYLLAHVSSEHLASLKQELYRISSTVCAKRLFMETEEESLESSEEEKDLAIARPSKMYKRGVSTPGAA